VRSLRSDRSAGLGRIAAWAAILIAQGGLCPITQAAGSGNGRTAALRANTPRPAYLGNGKGFAILSAVIATPTGGVGSPVAYRLQEGRWSPRLLAQAKKDGFGFVRLIATIMPLMSDDGPARQTALNWLDAQVAQANKAGLGVSLSLGFWSGDALAQDKAMPDIALRRKVIRAQTAVAAMLARDPSRRIALEFISEPHCAPATGPNSWQPIQLETWRAIRRVAPKLPLVLTGCRARVDTIVQVDAAPYVQDPNVIWSFHYYDFFAGQEYEKLRGVPFPPRPELAGSAAAMARMVPTRTAESSPRITANLRDYLLHDKGQATMRSKIESVAAWARRYRIPASHVSMNEWAPIFTNRPENEAIRADTLTWLRTLRQEAERQDFAWAYWSLTPKDLNFEPKTQAFRSDAKAALGLSGR